MIRVILHPFYLAVHLFHPCCRLIVLLSILMITLYDVSDLNCTLLGCTVLLSRPFTFSIHSSASWRFPRQTADGNVFKCLEIALLMLWGSRLLFHSIQEHVIVPKICIHGPYSVHILGCIIDSAHAIRTWEWLKHLKRSLELSSIR